MSFNISQSKGLQKISNLEGNTGAKFWGEDILKFDGSLKDKQQLLKIVRSFVKFLTEADIPIKFATSDKSYTDGKSIVISGLIIKEQIDSTIGLGLHEASHIVQTDFDLLRTLVNKQLLPAKYNNHILVIKDIFNWIEDRRIDYWAINKSAGYAKYYDTLYNRYFFNNKILKLLNKKRRNLKPTINNYLFFIINSMYPAVTMTELDGLKDIEDIIDLGNINRLLNSQDALDTAVKVFDIILKYAIITPKKQKKSSETIPILDRISDDFFDESEDSDNEDDIGNDVLDNEVEDDDIDDLDEDEMEELIDELLEIQRKFLNGEAIENKPISPEENELIQVLDNDETKIQVVGDKKHKAHILTINKVTKDSILNNKYEIFRSDICNDECINQGFVLGNLLGKKLKIRNDNRIIKSIKQKTGKLDKRILHSAGHNSEKLFYTISESKFNDINIHISIDASGSMGSQKWDTTLLSAIAIAKGCSMINGIRVQISFRWDGSLITVLNFYDSKFDNINKLKLLKYSRAIGGTPEGVCFAALKKDIMSDFLNKNSLFINFSDGDPDSTFEINMTKKTIDEFRKSGMSILSYFIGYSSTTTNSTFSFMYGKDSYFIDVKNMIDLAKTINNKILTLGK